MRRLFDNQNNLGQTVIARRIQAVDASAVVETYSVDIRDADNIWRGVRGYVLVESFLTDAEISALIVPGLSIIEAAAASRKRDAAAEARLATELKTISPAQAVAYVENNVTSLASAKVVLKIMVRMLIAMRDEVWPDLQDR